MQQDASDYRLDAQVGYLLRRVTQRHLSIFTAHIPDVTTTQFAAMAKLAELGPQSQNTLGRATSMDAATIKGVVDRLVREGLLQTEADPVDRRRITVSLTPKGVQLYDRLVPTARAVTANTLAPLSAEEQATLVGLLSRLA